LGERTGPRLHRSAGAVEQSLLPARDGLAVGLLPPPRDAPAADVRADQVLEEVEDVRILGDVEYPRAQQVRLRLHLLDVRRARLERLEPLAIVARALGAHRAD